MDREAFAGCKTIVWYDQYCENDYARGFKDYTLDSVMRDLDRMDADVYAVYATNQWGIAYYDSDVVPKYPPLRDRDYFGEVVGALKDRGKTVIGYVNWYDTRHPEWSWRRLSSSGDLAPPLGALEQVPAYREQGKGPVYKLPSGRWINPCTNSPRRQEIKQIATELVSRYPIDAFHVDMFFNPGICLCDYCRPDLETLLGTDEISYETLCQAWSTYLTWRQDRSTSLIAELAEIAHGHGVAFAPNAWIPLYTDRLMALSSGWWEHLDLYVTEAWLRLNRDYADIHSSTLVCKWLRALGMPAALLITGQAPGFSHAPLAEPEFRLHAASALSNGSPILGPCGRGAYPSTSSSQEGVATVSRVLSSYASRASQGARDTVKRIAVMWSSDTRDFYMPGEETELHRFEFLGYCRSLLENHQIFDVVLPERIGGAADLAEYELVILPNVACMSDHLAAVLEEYVAGGGKILSTYESGLLGTQGQPRSDFALGDVLGIRYLEPYPLGTCYVQREPEPSVCIGGAARTQATTATVISHIIQPDPDYPDSGLDLVPGDETPYPMISYHPYGRGHAWYVAASLGYAAYRFGYYQTLELLADLIADVGLSAWYQLEAPCTVELSMETDAQGTLYVHLTNQTVPAYTPGRAISRSIDQIIPLQDIRLKLYGPYRAADVQAEGVSVHEIEGGVECVIDRLADYKMIALSGFRQ